jgi:hypothetical protein
MNRLSCLFAGVLGSTSLMVLPGCPPVRNDDDDSGETPDETDLEVAWEALNPGACSVLPAGGGLLATGAPRATNGLWHEIACVWTGGNASSVTITLDYFDEVAGGDYEATGVRPVDAGGQEVPLEGDVGSVHVLPSDRSVLNGWWEGDLSGVDAAGQAIELNAVIFKDAPIDSVAGR